MEMQGRQQEGIAWMTGNTEGWSRDSFFAVHNWWHVALYHLDLGNTDEVLKLFDGPIYGAKSRMILEMIDASAMLWRMHLRGVDVGDRWQAVADAWEPHRGRRQLRLQRRARGDGLCRRRPQGCRSRA